MSKHVLLGIVAISCAMAGCSGGGAAASMPTISLTANPASVAANGISTLTWATTNANSCTASGAWSGPQSQNGSASTGQLASNSSYTLSCTGPGGTNAATAVVLVTGTSGVTVTPSTAPLTLQQTQQFSAVVAGGGTVTWSVDGVVGGNSNIGTINAAGLYATPVPSAAGTHLIAATSTANSAQSGTARVVITDLAGVYTYHNDGARTGQNLQEYVLTPAAVGGGQFGLRWTCALDGDVYTQPLYVAGLSIGGGLHNVIFVTTQHNSVYGFDADNASCAALWQVNLTGSGETTIPATDLSGCNDIVGEFGITGTPVIDPASQTLYVVAASKQGANYYQRLHALSLTTGAERNASPTVINATVTPFSGAGISFDSLLQNQRPALALTGGGVFIGWSSHCDGGAYWGWLMRYDAVSLQQKAVFNVAPNGAYGGIWMSGGAPAIDSSGAMFLTTGNGSFDAPNTLPPMAPSDDFSMSFLNLNPTTLAVQDFYTPTSEAVWSNSDLDISSGGVTVIPDGSGYGAHPDLLVGGDKQGNFWLLDRSSLGRFSTITNSVVQLSSLPGSAVCATFCLFSTPAYYAGSIYVANSQNPLAALPLTNGGFAVDTQNVLVPASSSAETYNYPGSTPSISASPGGGAVVWVLDTSLFATGTQAAGPTILRAYDANNLSNTLYTSDKLAADAGAKAVKFSVPTIANGRVYVGGASQLTVYGLAP